MSGRVNTGRKIRRIHTKLGVVGSEPFEPRGFHRRVALPHITKEVEAQGLGAGLGADFGDHIAHLRGSQKGTRKRAEPPDLQTATGMLGLTAPPMGAWMIGWSIFKRSSKRLFGQLGAAGGGAPCARAPTPVKIAAVVPAPSTMAFRLLI